MLKTSDLSLVPIAQQFSVLDYDFFKERHLNCFYVTRCITITYTQEIRFYLIKTVSIILIFASMNRFILQRITVISFTLSL